MYTFAIIVLVVSPVFFAWAFNQIISDIKRARRAVSIIWVASLFLTLYASDQLEYGSFAYSVAMAEFFIYFSAFAAAVIYAISRDQREEAKRT
jgi:hypothetical protein